MSLDSDPDAKTSTTGLQARLHEGGALELRGHHFDSLRGFDDTESIDDTGTVDDTTTHDDETDWATDLLETILHFTTVSVNLGDRVAINNRGMLLAKTLTENADLPGAAQRRTSGELAISGNLTENTL